MNEEKGGVAKKYCSVACTGCEKCVAECRYDAISVNNSLAIIDPEKCKLCRKCVDVCKSEAIHEINFPPPRDRAPVDRKDKKLARTKQEEKNQEEVVLDNVKQQAIERDLPEKRSSTKQNEKNN
jgi:ferredoxin